MLRCITNITIQQTPSQDFPTRTGTLIFNFCHEVESEDSWRELTNKGTLTLPKKVRVKNQYGALVLLAGTNQNLGGLSAGIPYMLRGDQITIQAGYRYHDVRGNERTIYMAPAGSQNLYTGYISKVTSKKPFVLEVEDNMWKLKQIPAPNMVFPYQTYTLEAILQTLLQGTGFTVNNYTSTTLSAAASGRSGINMGDFRTNNETIAQVLARIRKDYHFESYFRGTELRCGSLVYIESEAVTSTFIFQLNIISDQLEYQRKDDITLSAIAYSVNKNTLTTTTKDGNPKTKKERLEALVIYKNGNFTSSVKSAGQKADFAPNTEGERRTLYFWNVTDPVQLVNLAEAELQKYYYTGFKGKFTTFGVPFVRMGDNVKILDNILPERNGLYKVKSVKYKLGIGGHRQEIELDYQISPLDANGNVVITNPVNQN